MSGAKDYERNQRSIEKHAERLKSQGVEKTSEAARERARRVQRESEKHTTHREK